MGLAKQLKTILPWLCVVALVAGMLQQRSRRQEAETELAALRQTNQIGTRVDSEDLKKIQAQVEELGRLRKENEELHRLRNEVRQLREEKQLAAKTVPSAQAPAVQGKTDGATQASVQRQLQMQQLIIENERLRAENQQFQAVQANTQANACISNLRTIQGAKEQWALENKKTVGTAVSAQDIQPYLRNNAVPVCPLGGAYTLNVVGAVPTCSVPSHVLPQE